MKKRDFAIASRLRCHTKSLLKQKKILKKLRHKKAKRDPQKTDGRITLLKEYEAA